MASDNSFDVVSKVELQEVKNAIDQASKEVHARFDLKDSKSKIELEGTEAIQLAFCLGDDPSQFGLTSNPIRWSAVVKLARGISESDDEFAARFAA